MERLQKVLAGAGVASRRGAEKLIAEGRVSVNGQTVSTMGMLVDPATARVEVNGKPVRNTPNTKHVYLILNKPRGILTSRKDPHHTDTIYDLLPKRFHHLHYVGRLDKDSEGLLLLTDDGDLTFRLSHPRHHVDKTYRVELVGTLTPAKVKQLRQGMTLKDGVTLPAGVCVVKRTLQSAVVEVTLQEGRKRQVRRMFAAIGCKVARLVRIRIGPLRLGRLGPGEYRQLRPGEVECLRRISGLTHEDNSR